MLAANTNNKNAKKKKTIHAAHFLTDKKTSVNVWIFSQQLLTDVYGGVIVILDAEQDLVL